MKLHISDSNSKIGKIPNFSLMPIETCPNCKYCFQKELGIECYAVKAVRMYKTARNAWTENTLICKSDLNQFRAEMTEYLTKTKKTMFRIHVAGDFFSQEYLDEWKSICRSFPHIRFLAFTKAFDLDYRQLPQNLKIVWSVMPNMRNYPKKGPKAFAGDCVPDGTKTINCPGHCENCGMCWDIPSGYSVHFDIH